MNDGQGHGPAAEELRSADLEGFERGFGARDIELAGLELFEHADDRFDV